MSETTGDHCWISLRHSKLDDAEHNLDSLLGQLYDDMDSKVQASHMIYSMSLDLGRLGAMASHRSAMGALARVLREEGRKSFDLRFNMISTFQIFSYFQNFHQLLVENQIGRATLSFLDLETVRIHNSSAGMKAQSRSDQIVVDSNNAQDRKVLASSSIVNKPALHEQIEKKMRKFNLVECLCEVLHRTNTCLLIIAVAFLKRLSVYRENLNGMRENAIVFKLLCILHSEDESLLCIALRLLWNLSFDRGFREDMVDCGFLHSFEDLLQKRKFECLVWSILYNLSKDFDLRLKVLESKLISILIEPLLAEHDVSVPQELSALLINLTCIPKTAVVVKNLSFLEGTGAQLIPFVPALVASLLQCEPCIQAEVMETLNNLTCIEELCDSLVLDTGVLDYITAHLRASNTEDDINLQIIMFIGGVCSHRSAPAISQIGLVEYLGEFFMDRRDDVDIALQSLYAMIRFMLFDSTREAFLQSFGKVMDRILQLSQDSEKAMVTMAELVIDAVCHFDHSKKDLIRSMRFNMYNSGWSEAF